MRSTKTAQKKSPFFPGRSVMCQRNNVLMGKIESFATDDITLAKFELGDPSGEPSQSEDETIHSGILKGRQNNFTLVELLKKKMKFARIF